MEWMIVGLVLIWVLQLGPRLPVRGWLELESQKLMLAERPRRDSAVIAYYEVVPRTVREGVEVVFCDFEGVRPVGSDTIFHFNAREGIRRIDDYPQVFLEYVQKKAEKNQKCGQESVEHFPPCFS